MEKVSEVFVKGSKKGYLPISQAVRYGSLLLTAGQVSMNLRSGEAISGTIQEEVEQTLKNLKEVLEASGSSLKHVIKVTVFLSDMKYYEEMNEIYRKYFSTCKPARTCVESKLAKGFRIEMEAIAYVPEEK
jgi:2-iminobutanoate/2-iminopropanoate deaminase